jgi:integrase
MTHSPPPSPATATLQTVLDRLDSRRGLSNTRKRDLRSAVTSFAKLRGEPPSAIPLDLADIRRTLAGTIPIRANVSAKRLRNLRSDLAAAIEAVRLRPMINTAKLDLDPVWNKVLASANRQVRFGLSRFARWASLRKIPPSAVDNSTINRFAAELGETTLAPNLRHLPRSVAKAWNAFVASETSAGVRPVAVPSTRPTPSGISWQQLPASFREDVEDYLDWAAMPDPLAEGSRLRALAPQTLQLRKAHILSAVSAAIAVGIPVSKFTSLACLLEHETFRSLLRHRWRQDGCTLSAYTHGLTVSLIAIASEWVKESPEQIAVLKALRRKLGNQPSGLTDKNKALLRRFDDPRLTMALIQLPDRLWTTARRRLATSRRSFIDLQTALAIDLLIHFPLRLQNLTQLDFRSHLHWPLGSHKPALMTFKESETKNHRPIEAVIPAVLSERLQIYRNKIAPAVIGRSPDSVFVTLSGSPRKRDTIKNTIVKTLFRHLGVRFTPHQFRHLAAKIILDENPGAYELVRQLLGHTSVSTTTSYYAGVDTRRAGRAHADLVMKLRDSKMGRK